ncbi:uncharacterized protein LOC123886384 [Trifolium pratense]|uniref:uncharacterized protein LOC123886384 n=1 Tax=Trifolium pratense TaxID=57577 RepID=UPI001E691D5B|nr:uncharacterized protein LOC123886384 [Trifolium pratense]
MAKYINEGGSSTRPPLFEGQDYYYWKDKMELFLRSQDNNMWHVIEVGEYVPPPAKDSTTPRTSDQWTTQESDRVLLNTRAKLFIKSALNREEHDRIMECKTAKEMWETLQNHHEGSSCVKETRIDIGVRKFELFEMKEDETIDQMYGRFTIIINELNSVGKTYTAHERVRKILRSLPKDWRHIVIAITEAKDLSQLKLEDLIGSLKAHESIIQEDKPTQKRMIALESQVMEHSQNNLTTDNNSLLQDDDEEEFALISRRIQRLMMKRNQIRNSFQRNNTRNESDLSKVQCYGCNQFGHYKNDCPKTRQKPPVKNKSMMATWDEIDEAFEEEEQQEAKMCLMTHSDTQEVSLEPCASCLKTEHLFDNLLYDSQFITQQNGKLRDDFTKITQERDEYKAENIILKEVISNMKKRDLSKQEIFEKSETHKENIALKENVSVLENDIKCFVKSTETFGKIMGSQVSVFDKSGLGFKTHQKQKPFKNFFIPDQNKKVLKLKMAMLNHFAIKRKGNTLTEKQNVLRRICLNNILLNHLIRDHLINIRRHLIRLEMLTYKDPPPYGYLRTY